MQISFERQLNTIVPNYYLEHKINSDTIFFYINKAKDEYIKQLYRMFQYNQEISDKLRTLVTTVSYSEEQLTNQDNVYTADYPEDYLFALGETVKIKILNNKCTNLIVRSSDVLEATIETVDKILENSLSEYRLHYNQAKPVRVYTDNKILLYTDGNYSIDKYSLTYLKQSKKIGDNLSQEYLDLPVSTHDEIVNMAVNLYVQNLSAISTNTDDK